MEMISSPNKPSRARIIITIYKLLHKNNSGHGNVEYAKTDTRALGERVINNVVYVKKITSIFISKEKM